MENRIAGVWVRASERLPEKERNYHVRVKYHDDKPECWNTGAVWNLRNWEHPSQYDSYTGLPKNLIVFEWLDESQPIPVNQKIISVFDKVWAQEIAVDFAWENIVDRSNGYQRLRKQFTEWLDVNHYHKNKFAAAQQPIPVQEGLREDELWEEFKRYWYDDKITMAEIKEKYSITKKHSPVHPEKKEK